MHSPRSSAAAARWAAFAVKLHSARGTGRETRSCLVALTAQPGRMEEYRFILPQASQSRLHDITRAGEARLSMPDNAATLSPFCFKPLVQEIEILAAVVNLAVVVSGGPEI